MGTYQGKELDMAEVKCKYCGKKHALDLDGILRWYCPACKRYQETASESNARLTKDISHVRVIV